MADLAVSANLMSIGPKTFSFHSSDRLLPTQKPKAVLKVLVVSLSLRRANHSSDRWATSEELSWEDTMRAEDGDRVSSDDRL
uniref:Uncharacterized protein n=1 Tax=Arundo donax TaxID=35708 RepID=A0A0A8YLQ4_ARUDO